MLVEHSSAVLLVRSLSTGYGDREVLRGISLEVRPGQIVCILGHNGAGKSTLLKALFGLLPLWTGEVAWRGHTHAKPHPRELLEAGVCYVPQGNQVFEGLTVRENLELAALSLKRELRAQRLKDVISESDWLEGRLRQRAGVLSGGERQLLTLAMSRLHEPRLLLMDEPTLGLAPQLVSDVFARLRRMANETGCAFLVVEQKVRAALSVAEYAYVIRRGTLSFAGKSSELLDEQRLRDVYL